LRVNQLVSNSRKAARYLADVYNQIMAPTPSSNKKPRHRATNPNPSAFALPSKPNSTKNQKSSKQHKKKKQVRSKATTAAGSNSNGGSVQSESQDGEGDVSMELDGLEEGEVRDWEEGESEEQERDESVVFMGFGDEDVKVVDDKVSYLHPSYPIHLPSSYVDRILLSLVAVPN
jgi:hypothetical protein